MFVITATEGQQNKEAKADQKDTVENKENKDVSMQIQETPAADTSGSYKTPKK